MIVSSPFMSSLTTKVVKVQCGYSFSLALTTQGQVYSWGGNLFGQLGLGHSSLGRKNCSNQIIAAKKPTLIEDFVSSDDFVIDIAAGYTH